MRPIPLNLLTLYADLQQSRLAMETIPGSISTKRVGKKKYLYSVEKHGKKRIQKFLGPAGDEEAQAEAEAARHSEQIAKGLRSTVSALKHARIPAPTLVLGRILEVLSQAGLFEQGLTLVGTAAYQTYAPILGYYLPSSALMTNDVDLSVAEFVESDEQKDLEEVLKRADGTFSALMRTEDKLPAVFRAANGFTVDILTRYGRGRKTPVPSLMWAAEALSFQEYLAEEAIETVALYGHGVPVRVPSPERFAVHKLLVAQRRPRTQGAKKKKDLMQAKEIIDIFLESDESLLQDTLDGARDKGRAWRSLINASLREINRDARQGQLPVPVKPKPRRKAPAARRKAKKRTSAT